jgi:tetratricopeptide (TPR) repeat protein
MVENKVNAQGDAAKIAEARYALEQANDCATALQALQDVSEKGRRSQLFIYYYAKAHDCLSKYDTAIVYYNKFLEFVPYDTIVLKRVAKLSYEQRRKNTIADLSGTWIREEPEETVYTISQSGNLINVYVSQDGSLSFSGTIKGNYISGTKFLLEPVGSYRANGLCKLCSGKYLSNTGYIEISDERNKLVVKYSQPSLIDDRKIYEDSDGYLSDKNKCCQFDYDYRYGSHSFTLKRKVN